MCRVLGGGPLRPLRLVVVCLAVLVGCSACAAQEPSNAATNIVTYSALYAAEEVEDITRLAQTSALVIEGEVVRVAPVARAVLDQAPNAGDEMVYQDFGVSVSHVLKGSRQSEGRIVNVRVLGGTYEGLTVRFGEAGPVLREGDSVVLFLSDTPTPECPTGGGFEFVVNGGAFGSFKVRSDRADRDAKSNGPNDSLLLEALRRRVLDAAKAP